MKLQILDIDQFVKRNKIKPVTSSNVYSGQKLDPNGLFSEEIFGRLGSKERRKQFGYIDLKRKFIHPEAYNILTSINTDLSKLINNKEEFVVHEGQLINTFNDEKATGGKTGILFFFSIIDDINWKKIETQKPEYLDFITKNKNKLFIDKWLVLPAGIRDIQTSTKNKKTMIQFSEIVEKYKTLIQQVNILPDEYTEDMEDLIAPMAQQVQRTLLDIDIWFKNRLKGKTGLIKGTIGKKTIDYSGRFVITTDNTLDFGKIGLPFIFVLKLFEPFAIHELMEKDKDTLLLIQNYLKSDVVPSTKDLQRFFTAITEDGALITDEQLKQSLFEIAKKITSDKIVLYKRDPVENRDSYIAAKIRVDYDGYVMKVNPLDLPRTGADHDGDTMAVIALFSEESIKEAKEKIYPVTSKSAWTSVKNYNNIQYSIELDAAAAIYSATKV